MSKPLLDRLVEVVENNSHPWYNDLELIRSEMAEVLGENIGEVQEALFNQLTEERQLRYSLEKRINVMSEIIHNQIKEASTKEINDQEE